MVNWDALSPPRAGLRVVVVMPVRDLAARLPAALAALAVQTEFDGRRLDPASFEIVVLANNCSDTSAACARRFATLHPELCLHVVEVQLPHLLAHVGFARRKLMDEAARRLGVAGARRGVIASTDGDTCVEPNWIAATLAEIDAGADAVGGRIRIDWEAPPPPALLRLMRADAAHRLLRARLRSLLDPEPADPWPRHHQHFTASLAITQSAYLRVGGLPVVRRLEDEALVRVLRRADGRIRHSPAVRVRIPGRIDGIGVGPARPLRQWAGAAGSDREPLVEHPQVLQASCAARRAARALWRGSASDAPRPCALAARELALALGLEPRWLAYQFEVGRPFGQLWDLIEDRWRETVPACAEPIPIGQAVSDLRRRVRRCEALASRQVFPPLPHQRERAGVRADSLRLPALEKEQATLTLALSR